MKKKFALIAAILFILVQFVFAFEYVSIDAGLVFIGNSDTNSAPSPLLPAMGASLPIFPDDSGFYILPRILLYGTDYLNTGTRPAPAEIETSEFFVLGAFLDALAGYRLKPGGPFELGFLAGLTLNIRIPIVVQNTYADEGGVYAEYFYGSLRFVSPKTEVSFKWNIDESIGLSFALGSVWPLFHLWDGESLPFYDQLIVSGLLGVSIGL